MATVAGSWSRLWGTLSAAAFWVGLGAEVFDLVVIAPLWTAAPPLSVKTWAELALRPQPERFFVPFAAVLMLATLLAWLSGLGVRGSRRWWLTLAMLASLVVVWASAIELGPNERALASAAVRDELSLIALAETWLRWSLLRLGALVVGSYAAQRGRLVDVVARSRSGRSGQVSFSADGHAQRGNGPTSFAALRESRRRGMRREDFVWSDEDD